MQIEFILTSKGVELTDEQKATCRAYAIAETLAKHHDEFEAAMVRHCDEALRRLRSVLSGK